LKKPWDDKDKEQVGEDTHVWWWEIDQERQEKERETGLAEPDWKAIL